MDATRKIATVAGALFIVAFISGILTVPLLNPSLDDSNYLSRISANENQFIAGVLFQLIEAFAGAGIAISLYPILRKYGEGLALGSVGFRIIEAVAYVVGAVGLLSLLTLSQKYATAGAASVPSFQTLGTVLLSVRDWTQLLGLIAFYMGALMYYYVFYQSRLIPRWLSGWGLVGAALGMGSSMLVLFLVIGSFSTAQVVLALPIAANEITLAVWLMVKGFNLSATVTGSAKQA